MTDSERIKMLERQIKELTEVLSYIPSFSYERQVTIRNIGKMTVTPQTEREE